jgi:hypothetical protein
MFGPRQQQREDDGELIAKFDGRSVTYGFGDLDTLVPAYAATIHKSQGSICRPAALPSCLESSRPNPPRPLRRRCDGRDGRRYRGK